MEKFLAVRIKPFENKDNLRNLIVTIPYTLMMQAYFWKLFQIAFSVYLNAWMISRMIGNIYTVLSECRATFMFN